MAHTLDKELSAINAGTVKIGNFSVNRMGFGAMRLTGSGIWGPPADIPAAKEVLDQAVDLDVNFIDTADAYGPEVSENLIHDTLAPYEGLMIATKGGMTRSGPGEWSPDGRPEHLRAACEASLKRLGVDRITLYQFHRPDPNVLFEESIATFVDLQKEGKIRYIGLSNITLDQLKSAQKLAKIVSVQNNYNFEHRRDSESILQYCEEQGIAFIPYFPVGGGMRDFTQQTLQDISAKHDATPHQIALAWLLAHSPVMLPIPGTSSIDHLEENIAAASIRLDEDDLKALEELSD